MIITYTMYKQDEEAESRIQLSMLSEFAEIVLAGNTFPALETVLHALVEMQGYGDINLYGSSVEVVD